MRLELTTDLIEPKSPLCGPPPLQPDRGGLFAQTATPAALSGRNTAWLQIAMLSGTVVWA